LLGKQRGLTAEGWREAAGDYGTEGARKSIADVIDAETLQEVRANKKAAKAAAKAARARPGGHRPTHLKHRRRPGPAQPTPTPAVLALRGGKGHSGSMSATTSSTPMSEVLQLQRSAFHRDGPASAATRRDRIDRVAHAIVSHTDELVEAISADFGHRAEVTTLVTDIATFAMEAEHARARVGAWLRPHHPWGKVGSLAARAVGVDAAVHPSPLGVVGVMGIWNFPLNLTAIPALSALAAGNRVMIKMPEQLPLTSEAFANAVHDAFDVEEMAVLTGGVEVSKAFAALQLDHLFFTGSGRTGSAVMAAAAKNLTPVTLELGGKNPVVISPAAAAKPSQLRRAARRVALARVVNSGQVCISPDVVHVPQKVTKSFVQDVFATWGEVMPQMFAEDDVTTLIDSEAYERVTGLLEDAADKGAQVLSSVRSDE